MLDKNSGNKQSRIKFLDFLPNINASKIGDIVVTNQTGQTYLGIRAINGWKVVELSSYGLDKDLKINNLDVASNTYINGELNLRGDLRTPRNIYLRNSKIYFDMSETTPNDYITGGANDLKFYTNGTERLQIGVTSSTFSNIIVASDDIKLTSSKKLYFDGGQDTYITSDTDNEINFYLGSGVGGLNRLDLSESAFTGTFQDFSVSSTSSTKPEFVLKNTTSDATGPYIKLLSQRGTTAVAAQDDDYLGYIEFNGYDDAPNTQTYSTISSKIVDASSGSEEGALYLKAAANNGTLASGISLVGSSSALRADTTIHGKLTINSISSGDGSSENFLVENSGEVQKRTAAEVRSDIGAGTSSVAELNDLSDVTYSLGNLTISSLDTIVSGALIIDSSDDITLDAEGANIHFHSDGTSFGKVDMNSGGKLQIKGNTDYAVNLVSLGTGDISLSSADNITIDATDLLVFDTDGRYAAKQNGTEFSVANCAYAGMILGYRMIGEDATHAVYALTTSFAVPDSAMTVRFVAPPSGNVEVMIQIYANSISSNRALTLALSDNATFNSLGTTYEHAHRLPDETDDNVIQHYWTVTGLTAGSTYNYWLGAKTSATNSYLNWGGTAAGRYCDFIMKVTALPAAITNFAEYD